MSPRRIVITCLAIFLVLSVVGATLFVVVNPLGGRAVSEPSQFFKNSSVSEAEQAASENTSLQATEVEAIYQQYGEFAELTIPVIQQLPLDEPNLSINETLRETPTHTEYLASYTSEGNTINGLLTIPATAKEQQTPAVVFIHGYIPPSQYQTQERYNEYVDYLAENDLIVFKIDLRGHGQSEGEPSGAYFANDYVLDTLNAVEALKTLQETNPNKIGLWGHSMAGNLVARSLAVNPNIHAGVIWAGAVYTYADMSQFGIDDDSYQPQEVPTQRRQRRAELFEAVGERTEDNPFWQLVSPVDWLRDYPGTIQLHHAINDPTVTIEYSRNLHSLLDGSTVSIQLFEYNTGGHDLEGATFATAMERSVAAFKGE